MFTKHFISLIIFLNFQEEISCFNDQELVVGLLKQTQLPDSCKEVLVQLKEILERQSQLYSVVEF